MTRPLRGIKPAISYTIPEAALATGYSETVIRAAIEAEDIEPHYVGTKPVVLADDLTEWIRSLPTARVS